MNYLISKENPQIKELKGLLQQKKVRDNLGQFAIEGLRLAKDALESSGVIEKVFVSDSFAAKHFDFTDQLKTRTNNFFTISDTLALWAADTKNTQGLFVVLKSIEIDNKIITIKPNSKYILLDNLQDPGNMGTILRTALAFNIDGVFISKDSAEIYSPKVVRSAAGAVLKQPIEITGDLSSVILRLKEKGIKVYGTALSQDSTAINDTLFTGGDAVILGNEGNGLTEARLKECDNILEIPISNQSESLNVGVAAGIIMWEMAKK